MGIFAAVTAAAIASLKKRARRSSRVSDQYELMVREPARRGRSSFVTSRRVACFSLPSRSRRQAREQTSQGAEVDGFAHFVGNIQAVSSRQIPRLSAKPVILSADDDELTLESLRLEMGQDFNSIHLRHAEIQRQHVGLDAAQHAIERPDLQEADRVVAASRG